MIEVLLLYRDFYVKQILLDDYDFRFLAMIINWSVLEIDEDKFWKS